MPEVVRVLAEENTVIATEIMDDIVFRALGVHFLEPLVTFEQKIKIKSSIPKVNVPAEALNYMKKVDRKVDETKA